MKDAYTTKELALMLSLSRQSVDNRSARESWQSRKRAGRGGGREWLTSSMPEATRAALLRAEASPDPVLPAPTDCVVPDWSNSIALARFRLVAEWRIFCATSKLPKAAATEAFLLSYSSGGILPAVLARVGAVSGKTLYRWDKTLRDGNDDYLSLADRRGKWTRGGAKGEGQIGEDAEILMLNAWLTPNRPSVMLAYNAVAAALERRGLPVPSYASVWRFIRRFDAAHHDLVVEQREGEKSLRDNVGPYITRNGDVLSVGDILFSDGHRLNFDAINPLTGKPARLTLIVWFDWRSRMPVGWEIMPEEDTQAIASALRMGIQNLGKYPKAVYIDNGKAYTAEYFGKNADLGELDGLYARCGILVHHSRPYQAQAKIIERFWGTFNEQCARLLPSYRGNSVDDKPAYLMRAEAYHKSRHNGCVPTIQETAQIFSAFVGWYAQRPHRGLGGKTPWSVFEPGRGPGVDMEALERHFLLRRKVTPRRTGFSIAGIRFESDALYGINTDVLAMYSWADMSEVGLYDLRHGRKIGVARPVEALHPLAAVFGDDLDVRRVQEGNKRQAALRRETMKLARALNGDASVLESLPWMRPVSERRQPLRIVHKRGEPPEAQPLVSAEEAAQIRAVQEAERAKAVPAYTVPEFFASEFDRYEHLFGLKYEGGVALSEEHAAFMAAYEASQEYETVGARYAQLRAFYAKRAARAQGA